jgi:hypothetical protein
MHSRFPQMLRFVCEVPTAPLAPKLFAGALLALLFDFGVMAAMQLRGSRAAAAGGAAVGRFRALLALKVGAELAGAALIVFRAAGAAGAATALGGHLAFNLLNNVIVSADGAVRAFPAPARKPLVVTDALLTAVCAAGALTSGVPELVLASLFAAFAGVYCFYKYVLGKKL